MKKLEKDIQENKMENQIDTQEAAHMINQGYVMINGGWVEDERENI